MNATALLAMLNPTPAEEARLESDLEAITAFARTLGEAQLPPTADRPAPAAPLRADEPGPCLPHALSPLPEEVRP